MGANGRRLSLLPESGSKPEHIRWSIEGVVGFASVNSINAVEISRINFKNFSYDLGCQPFIITQQLNCIELR